MLKLLLLILFIACNPSTSTNDSSVINSVVKESAVTPLSITSVTDKIWYKSDSLLTLYWFSSGNTNGYTFFQCISKDQSSCISTEQSGGNSIQIDLSSYSLEEDKFYYPLVMAKKNNDVKKFVGREFKIDKSAPTAFLFNENFSNITDQTPRLSWTNSTDNISGLKEYSLKIGTGVNAGNIMVEKKTTNTFYNITEEDLYNPLQAGTVYHITLKSFDKAGNATVVNGQFTVGIQGIVDTSFDSDGYFESTPLPNSISSSNEIFNDVEILDNGEIIVSGVDGSNNSDILIYKVNDSGGLVTSFDGSGLIVSNNLGSGGDLRDEVLSTFLYYDRIIVCGRTGNPDAGSNSQGFMQVYSTDGDLEGSTILFSNTTRDVNFKSCYLSVIDSNPQVFISGDHFESTGTLDREVAIYSYDIFGVLQSNFNSGSGFIVDGENTFDSTISNIQLDSSNNIYYVLAKVGASNKSTLVKRNTASTLDTNLTHDLTLATPNNIDFIHLGKNNRLFLSGDQGATPSGVILKYLNDGTQNLDTSFGTNGVKTLIGSDFSAGTDALHISEVLENVDGLLYSVVNEIAGSIYLCRHLKNGDLDTSFRSTGCLDLSPLTSVKKIKFDNQGRLLVTGQNSSNFAVLLRLR